jgi:hypothetical protein
MTLSSLRLRPIPPDRHHDNLIIESKWQQSRGSVDEKFPFLVANIPERYPHATIIILDGGGYIKQAELWLRAQIDGTLLLVFKHAGVSEGYITIKETALGMCQWCFMCRYVSPSQMCYARFMLR